MKRDFEDLNRIAEEAVGDEIHNGAVSKKAKHPAGAEVPADEVEAQIDEDEVPLLSNRGSDSLGRAIVGADAHLLGQQTSLGLAYDAPFGEWEQSGIPSGSLSTVSFSQGSTTLVQRQQTHLGPAHETPFGESEQSGIPRGLSVVPVSQGSSLVPDLSFARFGREQMPPTVRFITLLLMGGLMFYFISSQGKSGHYGKGNILPLGKALSSIIPSISWLFGFLFFYYVAIASVWPLRERVILAVIYTVELCWGLYVWVYKTTTYRVVIGSANHEVNGFWVVLCTIFFVLVFCRVVWCFRRYLPR